MKTNLMAVTHLSRSKILINMLCVLVGAGASFFVFSTHSPFLSRLMASKSPSQPVQDPNKNCGYTTLREGQKDGLSNPLLMVDADCESSQYQDLKASIENYISENKVSGRLMSASVYFRNLNTGDWINCNPQFTYHPGSLAKVPMLFAYLKKAETDPAILKKVLFFDKVAEGHVHTQTFNSKAIEKGHSYTVKELLEYMIGYSDNAATYLLNVNMGFDPYLKIYSDLGLRIPSTTDRNYQMSTKEYSRFFIVLYNATYLSEEMSRLACTILNNSEFNEGLLKPLPANIKTIHKFGESGDVNVHEHELHESAVVFLEGKPYLLTVMTKGSDKKFLPEILKSISEIVYDRVSKDGVTAL